MPPLVSIFVQSYNMRQWVGGCLDSILRLEGDYSMEIIVVDDASRDGTPQVIESYGDRRIRYVQHERNAGAIATANEGYGMCQGEFVARIDSDDRYRPDFLARTVPELLEDPSVGLVYADIAMVDELGRITAAEGNVKRKGRPAKGDEFFALLQSNFIPAPTTLVRRNALQPLLPVPSDLSFLDWYLTVGITEQWKSVYVDRVLADYRIHTSNMHRSMIRNRSGEETVMKVLDRVFRSPVRAVEKRRMKNYCYARNYHGLGDGYFGYGMNRDARRCYWRAINLNPSYLADPGTLRRFLAAATFRVLYDRVKLGLRNLTAPPEKASLKELIKPWRLLQITSHRLGFHPRRWLAAFWGYPRYLGFFRPHLTSGSEEEFVARRQLLRSGWDCAHLEVPFAKRILVISPHPDDESIGAGGFLLAHRDVAEIHLLVVCNGERGGELEPGLTLQGDTVHRRQRLVDERKAELALAARDLNLRSVARLDYPDDRVPCSMEAASRLRRHVEAVRPDCVLLPWFLDDQIDHRRTNLLFAWGCHGIGLKVLGFEVWTMLEPNAVFDITAYLPQKLKLIQHYQSQLRTVDYLTYARALAEVRAYQHPIWRRRAGAIEAFIALPSEEYCDLIFQCFGAPGKLTENGRKALAVQSPETGL